MKINRLEGSHLIHHYKYSRPCTEKGYTHVTKIKNNKKLIKIRIIICNRLFEVGIASNRYLLSNGEYYLEIVQTACQGKKIIIKKLEK